MLHEELMGEWRLLSATLSVNEEQNSILDPNRQFIKLFTRTHFAFFSRLPERPRFTLPPSDTQLTAGARSFDAGGGRYEVQGNSYVEHIDYCSFPNYEGQSIAFALRYERGVLTQQGTYPLVRLGLGAVDGYLVETYQKLQL